VFGNSQLLRANWRERRIPVASNPALPRAHPSPHRAWG